MGNLARVQHGFIDRQITCLALAVTIDRRFQQEALLGFEMARQHLLEGNQIILWRQVGKKAQIATVDPDDCHIKAGQYPGGAQHIAVTANHNRQIALLAELYQIGHLIRQHAK